MKSKEKTCWFEHWFDSPFYHILYKNRDHKEAEDFLDVLMAYLQLPKGSDILDYACGKGRHSIYLNKKGFTVDGVDLSPENIKAAAKSQNENLHFYEHDIRNLIAVNHYQAVFNLFTSIGYFEHMHDNYRVVSSAAKALHAEGYLVIDFLNPDYVISHLVPSEVKKIDGYSFRISKKIEGNNLYKKIEVLDTDKAQEFEECVTLLTWSNFMDMLEKAGLTHLQTFGNYSLAPYDEKSSERMIIIAKK